ncbi:MAG: cysteine dioxygenase family protein [Flavobacteriales bacterium]|nr:cysteine dioxygenase family protein [Flavobacteriales bacterium]
MHIVTTIEQLIDELNNANSKQFSEILKRVNIPSSSFDSYSTWCEDNYTRNCIARTKEYEMILLCWEKGIKTAIHNHGGQDCWVYQIRGKIEECRYKSVDQEVLENPFKHVIEEGGLTYMNDKYGYHSLENISGTRALTLHVYNAPIDTCKVYDKESENFNTKSLKYDTFEGVQVD